MFKQDLKSIFLYQYMGERALFYYPIMRVLFDLRQTFQLYHTFFRCHRIIFDVLEDVRLPPHCQEKLTLCSVNTTQNTLI